MLLQKLKEPPLAGLIKREYASELDIVVGQLKKLVSYEPLNKKFLNQKEFYKKAPAALAGGSEVSGAMNNMLNAKEPHGFDSDTTRKYERYERMLIHRLKPAQMKVFP